MALELAFKAWAVWLAILLLAIANGVLREAMLVPALGKPVGQVLSGVLVPVLVVWGAYPALPWIRQVPTAYCWAIGPA